MAEELITNHTLLEPFYTLTLHQHLRSTRDSGTTMDILQFLTSFVLCLFSLIPSAISDGIAYGKTLTPTELNITQQLIDTINIPSRRSSLRQRSCSFIGTRASVSDTASCPWFYTSHTDNNRYPKRISNATLKACSDSNTRYCRLFQSTGNPVINRAGVCTALMETFPVIRYVTDTTGHVTNELSTEKVVVGFTCQRVPASNSNVYVVAKA